MGGRVVKQKSNPSSTTSPLPSSSKVPSPPDPALVPSALEKTGILHVLIKGARDLPAKDATRLSDPFVVLKYGNNRLQSSVVKRTLSPMWSQTFKL